MPTPVGHALAGIAAGSLYTKPPPLTTAWKDIAIFAILGQIPDLDFIPGILMGKPDYWHHGASHSIFAALAVGLIFYIYGRTRGEGRRWGLMAFWVVFSHVFLDAINEDTSPPHGIPLFWPVSNEYFLIYPLFMDVWRYPPWRETIIHNVLAVGLELIVLGPIALVSVWWRRRRIRGRSPA
jgi:membrane-bound metal-dependent hydrolase YbcI (DUF457 family)